MTMARVEGVDPRQVSDDYTAKVLAAQAKVWGAPLLNHLAYARRPSIFRGARGMWAGLDGSGLIDGTLTALLNRRVAALARCGSRPRGCGSVRSTAERYPRTRADFGSYGGSRCAVAGTRSVAISSSQHADCTNAASTPSGWLT